MTGFHWRISLLSRANRLCIAFNAGLRDSGLSCLSLLSLARSEMAIVRLPPDLSKNYFFFLFTSVEGKGTPLPFEAPANHLASFFFPLPMSSDPRSLKCKHLCDPQSFLTVTFWLLDNFSSTGREYHSHLLVSVSHHVTPPRLREEREMNRNTIEKKGNSIHCSFSFSFTFFFLFFFLTLLFFHPLSSSRFDEFFPFPFFVLPNFHYRGKQFHFSFFLSLSPFSFSLISFSFLSFSLSAFGRIIFQTLRR